MTDHKKYLREVLISDGKTITYRQLSRALKVHVNVAKEMLYEFHKDLNLRKPRSCHATYILSGLRNASASTSSEGDTKAGVATAAGTGTEEDQYMQSSPFELSQGSSSMEVDSRDGADSGNGKGKRQQVRKLVRTIVLVPEERVEEVKADFELLSSIHVYSIEPAPLKDLLLLADNTLDVQRLDSTEAPQDLARTYGGIMNKHANRRTGFRPTTAPPAPSLVIKPEPKSEKEKKTLFPSAGRKATGASTASTGTVTTAPTGNTSTVSATPSAASSGPTKKSQTDFFKSFGGGGSSGRKKAAALMEKDKAAAKVAASQTKAAPAGLAMTESMMDLDEEEDESMQDKVVEKKPTFSDDDKEDDDEEEEDEGHQDCPPPTHKNATSASSIAADAQRRRERDEKLRQMMMDDSDDEPQDTPNLVDSDSVPPSTQLLPPPPSSSPPAATTTTIPTPPVQQQTETQTAAPRNPRKRLRRKVQKRVTTRDEEGYLVTRTETVWESYSEDEDEEGDKAVERKKVQAKQSPVTIVRGNSGTGNASGGGDGGEKEKDGVGSGGKGGKKGAGGPAVKGQGNIMSFFARK
ncbi:DNA polymerase subunit Cdc27 [Kalaharituber pfeilii]|nr:DNA polymerase subunit Cdc27 [Kalaharituber pfeilii]